MTEKLVALRVRVMQSNVMQSIEARRDAGQGSLEYIGAILVAAAVVVLVLAAFGEVDLGDAVQNAVDKVTSGEEGE